MQRYNIRNNKLNKEIKIVDRNKTEHIVDYKQVKITRTKDLAAMVKQLELTFETEGNDITVIIKRGMFSNKVDLVWYLDKPLYSVTYKNKTVTVESTHADLNNFAKLFTQDKAIQKSLVKSRERFSSVNIENGQLKSIINSRGQQVELTKCKEIMLPAFMSQIYKAGVDIESFTATQVKKLEKAIVDFIELTGDVSKQRALVKNFIKSIKK